MKKHKNNLVPRLRFPDFKNSPEWEEKTLGDISPSIFDGTHQTPRYTKEGIPFYSVENIVSGNKNKFISREDYLIATAKNKPEKGDIILTRIGNIGFSSIISWDFDFSIYVTLAVIKKSIKFDSYYLHCYFQSDKYQQEIRSKSLLNAVPCKINMDELRSTRITLPTLEEQQKIADCLSSLDELITTEDKKLKLLKTYKKGLMQKLFPSEGETVPEWRFPEFRDSGDWEEMTINDIGEIVTGKTPSTSDETLWNGDIQFITPTDITEEKYQTKTQRTVADNLDIKVLPKNSILFTCIASIGKMALSVYPCITNQQINTIIPSNLYDNEFIYYVLLKKSYFIKSKVANTTLPIINKTEFSKFEIMITNDQKEQQKIADCLSSYDELIDAEENKIKYLKEHKKGLMQGLFPSATDIDKGEY